MPKKTNIPKKRVAKRTLITKRKPFGALPIPTSEQREAAVKAMEPFLETFQDAVDEQTAFDFGIRPRRRKLKE